MATSNISTNFLTISWSTSKGRDTYGYNICRLDDNNTGQRYRTIGGGYDMVGTVIGEWMTDVYQDRLMAIADRTFYTFTDKLERDESGLYGMYYYPTGGQDERGRVSLDGGCGIESMRTIAKAIGLSLSNVVNKRGHVTGYMVTDYGSAEAMEAA